MRVQRGKGYSLADKNKRTDDTIGSIAVDALYNPILNVTWNVEPIATSSEGHEKLTLSIESDGSTTPRDAINHAASILRQQLALFMFTDSSSIKAVETSYLLSNLLINGILLKILLSIG